MSAEDPNRRLLNDIRAYLRISATTTSRPIAARILDSYEKALVYTKLDGTTSTYKIAEATGVPQRTVLNWADECVRFGLASPPDEFFQSHRSLFSLTELSVDLSTLKKRKKTPEGQTTPTAPTLDSAGGGQS